MNTASTERRLAGARLRTRLSLFWEDFWPRIVPLLVIAALFLVISWAGIWAGLGDTWRIALLVLFAVAGVASLWPLLGLRRPSPAETDRRLESHNGLPHRPVTAQTDRPVSDDPKARALWEAERVRAEHRLDGLAAPAPRQTIARRDPFALRAAVVFALFVAFFLAGSQRLPLIADAFKSDRQRAVERARIDVWVAPPAYTQKPPVFLARSETLARTMEEMGEEPRPLQTVNVPEGSKLIVRTVGLEGGRLLFDTGSGPSPIGGEATPLRTAYEFTVNETGVARLEADEQTLAVYAFSVADDQPPTVSWTEEPSRAQNGALQLDATASDDYRVASARVAIEPAEETDGDARPLVEAPAFDLPLSRSRPEDGVASARARLNRDLTAHPLAGASVDITLFATDDAGHEGRSEPHRMVLPARRFADPLAKALVHERRRLALDANRRRDVQEMIDIISTTHPDEFMPSLGVYTSLRVAYRRLRDARGDDDLRGVLDLLWEIALGVEDGDLSVAERRLRDAQEALAEALENGASDEEIEKLMQELRQAMAEFMQELAQRMQNQPQSPLSELPENLQTMTQQDLDRMMDRIEDLAKSGSRDAARDLLSEMQRMMDNMQAMQQPQRGQQGQQQGQDEFGRQMNELSELLRQQQELMDRTFDMQRRQREQQQGQQGRQGQQQQQQGQQGEQRQGEQDQGQGGQQPMTPEEMARALKRLQQQQQELQNRLEQMQQALEGMGMQPNEGLGQAGEEMGNAEGQLGEGQAGEATGSQGRALQALRDGAGQMMQQMQQMARQRGQQGQQPGQGRGEGMGEERTDRDPLGRQTRTRGPQLGNDVKVPDEIDAQRARRTLETIRRRLGEQLRPRFELDYLERLLPGTGLR